MWPWMRPRARGRSQLLQSSISARAHWGKSMGVVAGPDPFPRTLGFSSANLAARALTQRGHAARFSTHAARVGTSSVQPHARSHAAALLPRAARAIRRARTAAPSRDPAARAHGRPAALHAPPRPRCRERPQSARVSRPRGARSGSSRGSLAASSRLLSTPRLPFVGPVADARTATNSTSYAVASGASPGARTRPRLTEPIGSIIVQSFRDLW